MQQRIFYQNNCDASIALTYINKQFDLGARLGVFFGVVLVMGILEDLFKKAPQSIKDKYKIKIREKAIERVKKKIIKHNKKIEDYSDDQMEAMIAEAENGLNDDVKKGVLTALLVAAGIEIVTGG